MAKAAETMAISIPPIEKVTMELVLVGDSMLVVHSWSAKAKQMILAKQMKKAKGAKVAKDPEQDFLDSLYWLTPRPKKATPADVKGATFGFPAIAFKSAAVDACSHVDGFTKVGARGAFHIDAELIPIEGAPEPREDMVRVGMGTADIRYRGMFQTWRVKLPITYNARLISPEQIVNLFQHAGFGVGVGEHRPAKDGTWGRFHVAGMDE